jgi:hypothetical protein
MDDKFLAKERRKQKCLERLGTNSPQCIVCGEDNPHCLELHHIAGRRFDHETVIVCKNCHRKLSDAQRDHPKSEGGEPSLEERLVHFLLGVADLLELLVTEFREFANRLLENAVGERS